MNNFIKLVDVINLLPNGTSYRRFLEAFDIQEHKLWFPYEAISCEEDLDQNIPDYKSEKWYSSLQDCHLLDVEYNEWRSLKKKR